MPAQRFAGQVRVSHVDELFEAELAIAAGIVGDHGSIDLGLDLSLAT